ncbi:ABC transporter permease [Pseudoalteromonas piscicida]|uniref:ABC transporter permease n=1 Tax=Pseudoalteromonas piscicida TaxID=43662 RepID=UPI001C950812|nr:FtsX-like permease family protein [Pseudoalteromonas piscicida]QZO14971.1 ABC transporter permease [Pseudoalteromonas piscicida]
MNYWIDIKYVFRGLLNKPLFSSMSILIVAIGLGLSIYTYTLLSQLIFKPLTLNGDTPIVAIEGEYREAHGRGQRTDPFHLSYISQESKLIDNMSLYRTGTSTISNINNGQGSIKVYSSHSDWDLFEVAKTQPALGRGFSPEDHEIGAEPVVVISFELWDQYFARSEDILNMNLKVNGISKQVIGVMPAGFSFPAFAQVWQPLAVNQFEPTHPSDAFRDSLNGVARLKPGVSLSQFEKEVGNLVTHQFLALPQEFSWRADSPGGYIRVFNFKMTDDGVAHHYPIFIAMFCVVVLILFLSCINIGNLLLARVNARAKEVAIRISLGIPRKRLILQMLWESLFICGLGALLAFIFASFGTSITNDVLDEIFSVNGERPFWWVLSLEMDAILVLLLSVIFMVFVTGFIPAMRALAQDVNAVLRDGTRGALGKKAGRMNKLLVISEVILSSVVLVVATLLLSTGYAAQNADYGVKTQQRLTATIQLPSTSYPTSELKKRNDFYYQLKDKLEQQPNINGVGYFTSLPGTGGGSSHFEIQGKEALVYNENPMWNFEVVSRDAWQVVGMNIIEGRGFELRDVDSGESPTIINASMAEALFPNNDALGQKVRTVDEGGWHTEWRTIVGIVSDSVHGPTMQSTSAWHTGYGLMDLRGWTMEIVIHYSGSLNAAESALRQAVNGMDNEVTLYHVQSYQSLIKQPMLLVNAVNTIFLWCGVVALMLAASGIYAVSSNSIIIRTQEIATRRALGAKNSDVIKLFLKEASLQLGAGLAFGILMPLWVISQITKSMIIDGNSYVIGLVGIPVFISLIVLWATYYPSNKMVKQEPCEGLRQS